MKTSSFLSLAAALCAVAITPATAWQTSRNEPPKQPGITVSNSPGAVTGNNNRVNIYQEARRDPVTQQFVATLQRYTRLAAQMLQPNPEVPVYMFSIEDNSSRSGAGETGIMFQIIVGDVDEEASGVPVRECGDDFGLYGFQVSVTRGGDTGRMRMKTLVGDNAGLLDQLCRSLRRPLSTLGDRSATSAGGVTLYDYFSRGNAAFGVVLMPSRMMGPEAEESVTRGFWNAAFALRYNRTPQRNFMTPEFFGQLDRLQSGEWIDAALPIPPGFANPVNYPPQARQEFGARIDRLDADWVNYLGRSAVTLRNRQHPIWEGDHPRRFVPRFSLQDVGSTEFWRAAEDLRDIMEQTNCIAQHFLVDRQYLPPDESVAAGQCPLGEVRLLTP